MRTSKITPVRVLTALAVILAVGLIAVVASLLFIQQTRIDNLRSLVATTKQADSRTYGTLLDRYTSLYKQLQREGITPTAPSPQQVATAAPGATGRTGDTGASGRGIVDVECESDGDWLIVFDRAPTTEKIPGPCVGETGGTGATGATGSAGTNGADSTVPGPKGDKGDTGDAGRGVTDISCVSTGMLTTAFRFTFTDGSTQDVMGACTPG